MVVVSKAAGADKERADLLDKQLRGLSKKLVPWDDFLNTGKEIAQKVYELIAQKSGYKVARFVIAGSAGKKTSIVGCDFDCSIFINGQEPPFTNVLKEFEDIIKNHGFPGLTVAFRTGFALKLNYKDLIQIDFLPATNFVNPPKPSPESESEQAFKVFEKLRARQNDPKAIRTWSSSLAESNVKFMSRQTGFIHELARLAKFWNKMILIEGTFSGRSVIIELLAVYAGQEEEKSDRHPQMLRACQRFLGLVERLDDPRLVIEFNDFNALSDCSDPNKRNLGFKPQLERSEGKCTIRDPVNPFYNLMSHFDEEFIHAFKFQAKSTLDLLNQSVTQRNIWKNSGQTTYLPLEYVFQACSALAKNDSVDGYLKNSTWLSGVETGRSEISPSMIVRVELSKSQSHLMEGIKTYLMINVMAVSTNPDATSTLISDQTKKCIDKSILGVPEREWGTYSGEKHEDYDVTFVIPFKIGEKKHFSVTSIKPRT